MISISTLKNFRLSFGLTQDEAAGLLGTTRSQLTMAERGRRPIPIDVGIRLLELMEQVDAGKKEERELLEDKTSDGDRGRAFLPELADELTITRAKLSAIDAKLIRLEQNQQRLKTSTPKREQLIAVLQQQQPTTTALCQAHNNYIQKKSAGCHADKKLRLLLQRDLLLAKANVISHYLGKGSN